MRLYNTYLFIFLLSLFCHHAKGQSYCGFPYSTDFRVGIEPLEFCSGDFDGDGDLDLATANQFSDDITVLLNDGDGNYFDSRSIAVGDGPRDVVAKDLDGDGDLDLAALSTSSDTVSILINPGNGEFSVASSFPVADSAISLIAGDWDGDGDNDLMMLVTGVTQNCLIHQFLNTGNGEFQAGTPFSGGTCNPSAIKAADLDNDQDLDLVFTVASNDEVATMFNNGNGVFSAPTEYPVGDLPRSFDIGDVDGDGDPDLAICNLAGDTIQILLNDGRGQFFDGQTIEVISVEPTAIVFGLLNLDNALDFAVVTKPLEFTGSTRVNVYLNNGSGNFSFDDTLGSALGPDRIVVDDANGDSLNDVLVLYDGLSDETGGVYVLLNQGDADFSVPGLELTNEAVAMVAADLDNDGDEDLVIADRDEDNILVLTNSGNLALDPTYYDTAINPQSIITDDLNNDGRIDIAVRTAGRASIFLNVNNTGFMPSVDFTAGPSLRSIAFADLDNDGWKDLIFGTRNDGFGIRFNLGNTVFGDPVAYDFHQTDEQILSIVPVDVNIDGSIDLVLGKNESEMEIWLNDGLGQFEFSETLDTFGFSSRLLSDDVNSDGIIDLVVGGNDLSVFKGNGISFEKGERSFLDGAPGLALYDVDGDGDSDAVTASSLRHSVSIHLNDGMGLFETAGTWRAVRTPSAVAVGEFGGSARNDLAVVSEEDGTLQFLLSQCDSMIGDVNLDGVIDLLDVAPFVDLLISSNFQLEADINGDGAVDLLDIQPFVALLAG